MLVAPDAALRVAVDDSVSRRAGRKVHGAGWQHDGSSPGMNKLSFGNCFVTAALVTLLALAFPDRTVHVVPDAACHGPALRDLPASVTWTCRLPRNAVLYDLAPPRTGKRGPAPRETGSAPPPRSPPPPPGPP
jgi:hypothetical protein